jgi:hypothetical protein
MPERPLHVGRVSACADQRRRVVVTQRVEGAFAQIPGLAVDGVTVVQREDLLSNSLSFASTPSQDAVTGTDAATGTASGTATGTEEGRRIGGALYHWWLVSQGLPVDGSAYPGQLDVASLLVGDASLADAALRYFALSDAQRVDWMARRGNVVLTCRAGAFSLVRRRFAMLAAFEGARGVSARSPRCSSLNMSIDMRFRRPGS